jgi:hypothetical protein
MSAPDGEGNSKTHSSFKFLNFVLHLVSLYQQVLQTKTAEKKSLQPSLDENRKFCLRSLQSHCFLSYRFRLVKILWFGAGMKEVFTLSVERKDTKNTRHKSLFVVKKFHVLLSLARFTE